MSVPRRAEQDAVPTWYRFLQSRHTPACYIYERYAFLRQRGDRTGRDGVLSNGADRPSSTPATAGHRADDTS